MVLVHLSDKIINAGKILFLDTDRDACKRMADFLGKPSVTAILVLEHGEPVALFSEDAVTAVIAAMKKLP